MIKKGDVILAAAVVSAAMLLFVFLFPSRKGGKAVIYEDNKKYGEYSLSSDAQIDIKTAYGSNTVTISEGFVSVSHADCPDKYCVSHVKISKEGETIVCLPHRLVIKIEE